MNSQPVPSRRRHGFGLAAARWICLILLLLLPPLSCVRPQSGDALVTSEGRRHLWQPIYRGLSLVEITAVDPRPLKLYAIRVDLHDPDVRFLVTPAEDGKTLHSMYTSTFLEKYRCQVAVNGSPFGPVVAQEGLPQQVRGLQLSQGTLLSPPQPGWGVLLFTRDHRVRITQPPVELAEYYHGLGGFDLLIEAGRILPQKNQEVHPRTAAGLTRDQRYFYLLVIDGRQPSYSEGVTLHETAQWLERLGCWWGINLDGGGSSTLVVADPQGHARVVNVPIDRGIPGTQRPNANHLGIYARPLP